MGTLVERCLEFAVSVEREIHAPASAVWEKYLDIDSHPSYIRGIHSNERLGSSKEGDPVRLGTRLRVTRLTERKEFFSSDWTVVAITDDDDESITKSITFYTEDILNGAGTCSSTWTVTPIMQPSSVRDKQSASALCIASISIAIVPRRFCVSVGRVMFVCVVRKRAIQVSEIDLRDFAIAAGDSQAGSA